MCQPSSTRKERRVLIVEDDRDLAESLQRLLAYVGCEVEVANTGLEAFRIAVERRPDIIIIDIRLPGMNGYELVRSIRAWLAHDAIVIGQTAYGTHEDRPHALAAGFDELFIKPVPPEKILRYVWTSE